MDDNGGIVSYLFPRRLIYYIHNIGPIREKWAGQALLAR